MTVLVVGCQGQVGRDLVQSVPADVECVGVDLPEFDITDAEAVRGLFARVAPRVVVNVAAYTAVDRAESEAEAAYAVNETGPSHLAAAAREAGARMIHFSTDFVFDGTRSSPYLPDDQPNPLGVYGASKLAGEVAVQDALGEDSLVLRTAWVYSRHGHNFAKTMLRLFSDGRDVRVVADQVGTPTAAHDLAGVVWSLVGQRQWTSQTLHVTNSGVCSWYDFAVAVGKLGVEAGLLSDEPVVEPILTEGYPTPATRPAYSVLETSQTWELIGYRLPHWRSALKTVLRELAIASDA